MGEKFKYIIVDDDPDANIALSKLLYQQGLVPYKTYTDPLLALSDILSHNGFIEIAFLDVDMPLLSGLELAERIKGKVHFVVFVTAFREYSLKAFRVNAIQYLIKPITKLDLIEVISQINQIRLSYPQGEKQITDAPDDGIYLLAGIKGQYLRLEMSTIILFSAEKNQIHIYTDSAAYMANAGISRVMDDLHNDSRFMRIHKSHIIRLNAIKQVVANLVYLDNGYRAPVSPQYRTAFFNYIQQRILKNRP